MVLPLSAVLGSHRDIDPVMFGVKHTFLTKRSSPDNYIHRAAADAAGINSTSSICPCECPRFDCPSPCRRIWKKAGQTLSVFSTLCKSESTEISLELPN